MADFRGAVAYCEIKLDYFSYSGHEGSVLLEFQPDFIHIATEGPLGWTARRLCLYRNLPFTTAYHTRFPEYLAARVPRILASFLRLATYAALRRFHAPSNAVMVATASMKRELKETEIPPSGALVARRRYNFVPPLWQRPARLRQFPAPDTALCRPRVS